MKRILMLIKLSLLLSICALGQDYDTNVPVGAPVPSAPASPQSLGVTAPEAIAFQQPTASEQAQGYVQSTQTGAMALPAGVKVTGTAAYGIIVPPSGGVALNNFYVSYAPQSVASCYIYGYLPLWMSIRGSGSCWTYEWYPDGHLVTQYAGNFMPGWYKGWFYGDMPGWHILQYYCSGWSNYIYVYVNPYRTRDYGNVVYKPPSYPEPTPMPEYPAPMPFSEYRDVSGPPLSYIEPSNIQTSAYSSTIL